MLRDEPAIFGRVGLILNVFASVSNQAVEISLVMGGGGGNLGYI